MNIEELQQSLEDVLALNQPGTVGKHVLISMPSFGLGESTLAHYAERIPALEHRYLNGITLLSRIQSCEMIYLCSVAPPAEVIDYYFSLIPDGAEARGRLHIVSIDDPSAKSLANKLRRRPEKLDEIRQLIGGRPRFIEPWNVTDDEVMVAEALEAPINGTLPAYWPLGFKSACRRLFKDVGVPTPFGLEGIRTVDDVRRAISEIVKVRPDVTGVVVKHDNSGSGDGNVVVRLPTGGEPSVDEQLAALPEWYVRDLAAGGVVEELIAGSYFASPSAQVDIRPDGSAVLLATHEQILGGADKQIYQGCTFPADSRYAPELAEYALVVGRKLSGLGAMGRFSIDFVAVANGADWRVFGLEINLRKGGTTHPYAALRNLAPGHYEPTLGAWVADQGGRRFYHSTDNVVDPRRRGMSPQSVITVVRDAGLQFDTKKGTGVVLHMLSCLAIDGRFGLTSIAESREAAMEMSSTVESVVRDLVRS